ncbi:MAG TPA: biotin/lipoyl-containing protein [Anaeromyxobacteraceae bacterium]|nr:biotin/lipoyl-containing protein [Anaeromyxobacteraceae bacterium]
MSRYVALLEGGRELPVEVTPDGPGIFQVRLGDRVFRVDAFKHDYGTLSLIVDTASYTATLDPRAAHVNVRVRDSIFKVELLDERRLRMRRAAGRLTVDGRQPVATRVPARVVRVHVRDGDAVKEGQPLVTVAALGMENDLRSPKDGTVIALDAAPGQAVGAGAELCAVE